ncbi:MAG: glycosyl hydrolase [Verrucomicrobia bacterium]|nr:glycosyl hydrolase [Verrucomicrobiota bacterium]
MKPNTQITQLLMAGLLAGSTAVAENSDHLPTGNMQDALEKAFAAPPNESKPWCYWWWLNGAASKEGITRDFEEMRKQGISGALLFDAGEAGPEAPRGPRFMSEEWRELYRHAVREADRCGIALGVNLCSGWDAGGPWVTPEHAAKKLAWAQTSVKGPGHVNVALPKPEAVQGFYRDIVVLASPMVGGAMAEAKLCASSQYQNYAPARAEDGDEESRWISNGDKPGMGPTPEKPEFLQFDFDEPWTAAGIYLKPYSECGPKDIEVQCSDDGQVFRPLKRQTLKPRDSVTVVFDEARGKHFRVVFLSAHPFNDGASWNVQVAEIGLLSKDELANKAEARWVGDRARALDISKFTDPGGQLSWDVPPGNWKVLRIGCTLHGDAIKCVGGGPSGPELDPMSAAAMDAHFAETGAKLIDDAGPLAGKSLQYFHIDSWELGQPTWTPQMREEFQRRRGYDPLPFLPAVLGRTVDDADSTRRFLQDYRRTAADLVAANYYGRLRELTLKGGLRGTHPESGGPFFTHWIDGLQCEGINDVPMGEFWKRNIEPDGQIVHHHNPSLKQAACAAHIYGKRDCQAEAFTSFGDDWADDPWSMKDIGDAAFCDGLTRNVLCFWVHQPRLDAKPGFQWAHVGTHFDCNLTWWPLGSAWLTYLARCQHLLRQGLFVADFAYLQDEAIPGFIASRPQQQPALPSGFDYDVLNAEVLLSRAAASNGRLALPNGMSYRYLVLPQNPGAVLSPATLRKVDELAKAGVTVIGPNPLAAAVSKMREGTLDAAVRADGLVPDIEFRNPPAGAKFDWIHRRHGDTEIYFISNQSALDTTANLVFRVAGKQPELWDAVTGGIRDLPDWREENGRTIVPMQFVPRQSWFVMFSKKAQAPGKATTARNFPELEPGQEIGGAWDVSFDPSWGGPKQVNFEKLEDWTARSEDGIRYYSGIATYKKSFQWTGSLPEARQVFLDLGAVKNLARVRLNGRDLGVIWTAPWRVSVTNVLKAGSNELEIDVANLWPNRLIGDAALPKEKRITVTNVRTYDTMSSGTYGCPKCEERKKSGKPAALLSSGLLGPARLLTQRP